MYRHMWLWKLTREFWLPTFKKDTMKYEVQEYIFSTSVS